MLLLIALLSLGMGLRARTGREPELPVLGQLPSFALLERAGQPVTLESLRGRVWVANFFFTRCGGICPTMTARLVRLRREVAPEVTFVSFTVDPDHDTAQELERYARQFGIGPGWLFVTGTKSALYGLATKGFKLAAMELPPDQQAGGEGPFLHSGKLALVDAHGQVRGYFDSDDETAVAALAEGIRSLGNRRR